MVKRKSIPKKIRFEVFKRDNFACQYFGKSAPDVLLVIDHIKPISKGGDNDIMNLITACADCNAGKGPRELDDNTVIEKQKKQLEQLNERRIQLEMLLEWRNELENIDDLYVQAVCDAIENFNTGYCPNDRGKKDIRKWLKKYSLQEILDAVDISFEQYIEWEEEKVTSESWNKAFNYIPRIVSVERRSQDKPHLKDLFYIRGILRNRLHYVNEQMCMRLLEDAHDAGATVDSLREFALSITSWTKFRDGIHDFLEKQESQGNLEDQEEPEGPEEPEEPEYPV